MEGLWEGKRRAKWRKSAREKQRSEEDSTNVREDARVKEAGDVAGRIETRRGTRKDDWG